MLARDPRAGALSALWNARRAATVLRGSARCSTENARQTPGNPCAAAAVLTSRRPTLDTVRTSAAGRPRRPEKRAPVFFIGSTGYTWQQSVAAVRAHTPLCHFLVKRTHVGEAHATVTKRYVVHIRARPSRAAAVRARRRGRRGYRTAWIRALVDVPPTGWDPESCTSPAADNARSRDTLAALRRDRVLAARRPLPVLHARIVSRCSCRAVLLPSLG